MEDVRSSSGSKGDFVVQAWSLTVLGAYAGKVAASAGSEWQNSSLHEEIVAATSNALRIF